MRKYMSILLCICMLLSAFPTLALAEGEMCENHPQHTEDCGYAPAFAGSACKHELGEHDDACYQSVTACLHQHGNDGCTYTPAKDAVMCTHVCDASVCGYVAPRPENPCACQPAEDGTFAHVENCGYVPADPGVSCNFQHGAHPACTCVPAQPESGECNHVCSTENGCITSVLSCTHAAAHDENCGYAPATEGSPCTHSCELCKPTAPDNGDTTGGGDDTPTPEVPVVYPGCAHHNHDESCGGLLNNCTYVCEICVAEIQQMVNALPDNVTPENQSAVEAALAAIQQRYIKISTNAFQYIDWTKFEYITLVLSTPQNWFGFAITKRMDWAGEGLVCNFSFIDNATGAPATLVAANGAAFSSVDLIPNGAGAFFYLPAGTYTIVEQVEGDWTLSTIVNGAAAPGNTFTGAAGGNYNIMLTNTGVKIFDDMVKLSEDCTYDGMEHKPIVTVELEYGALSEEQYTVEFERNGEITEDFTNAGEISVTVSGVSPTSGKVTKTYTIKPATPTAADFDFTPPAEKIATGDTVSADIAVKPDVSGMGDVTVSYCNDKGETATPNAAGTYIVKIEVAAGKNYTAVQGLGDAVWTFTLEKDPADTANTEKVKDITKDNVKPENKTDLEKAKEDLEKALEDNKDKYTDEQKKDIQADIDRIDEALKALPPAAAQYIITYGNHGYWYKGSYYALGFKCDGPYAKFLGITIDGLSVDRAYYTAFEGSTVVSLSPQLLNLLPVGPHTITFAYTDGSATGYFYVLKAPINAVMTGDDSDMGILALMTGLGVLGSGAILSVLRKRKTGAR